MTLTFEKFAQAMEKSGCGRSLRIAVGVSGGGDSMALALLLKEWGADILALTVDHALRAESQVEAEKTGETLAFLGIQHKILTWQGVKPETHVQERARDARYDLLLNACRSEKITMLAVAHNLEDQMETFWMRLAHGSGIDGLAAMAPSRDAGGIKIIRPLLSFTREELRDYCRLKNAAYIDDPSNENEKFLRVKLRKFENLLAEEGLTPQRLSRTLQKLENARDALQWLAEKAAADCVLYKGGNAAIDHQKWLIYPEDIRQRLLSGVIMTLCPGGYAPGAEALARLSEDIGGTAFAGATLGGCIFSGLKKNAVTVSPEALHMMKSA